MTNFENLTVIIPFYNGHATIERLLDSLPSKLNKIVVDDLSAAPYKSNRSDVQVLRMHDKGYFAGACNYGMAHCDTDVLILNQDVWLEGTDWQQVLKYRTHYAIGGDGVLKHPAFPNGYVQGTFMWLTRDVINALTQDGQEVFDSQNYPLWGCTCLAQLRACRMGYRAMPVEMQEYGMRHARENQPFGSAIKEILALEPEHKSQFIQTPPAISVIITCYNYGRFLKDAVASLIGGATFYNADTKGQTFQSFEIIIVDDASDDDSAQIAHALADDWRAIRFISLSTNVGSAEAANIGIENSFGKYITVLDADDMMQPQRLETLYRVAQQNPHAVIYDNILEVAESQSVLQNARQSNAERITKFGDAYAAPLNLRAYDFDRLLERNGMHKGIFFERTAFNEIGGYPREFTNGREDWAINVAFGIKGYCGVHVSENLYLRRQHGANRHLKNTTREWLERFRSQLEKRFTGVYAGERPTMCCGGGSNKGNPALRVNNNASASLSVNRRFNMATNLPGQEGMVLLEYAQNKSGTKSFIGPVTGTRYVFGGTRRVGYVDARDAQQMLNMRESQRAVFQAVTTNAKTQSKAESAKVESAKAESAKAESDATPVAPVDDAAENAGAATDTSETASNDEPNDTSNDEPETAPTLASVQKTHPPRRATKKKA